MWPLRQGPRPTNHRCTMPVWHFHYGGRGTIIIGLTSWFVRLKLPGNRPSSTSPKRLRRFFFQISRFTATWISRNAKRIHLVFQHSLAKTEANPSLPVGDESSWFEGTEQVQGGYWTRHGLHGCLHRLKNFEDKFVSTLNITDFPNGFGW